jgi:shikimate dehydrogenase
VKQTADRYCVIGNPIAHSKSPQIHAAFAAQTGQDLRYERCLAPLDGFAATVRALIAQGYRGANVTVPFKLEAAALATRLTERAHAAGAVNTLHFTNGEIVGDNTDGPGLVADIVRNAGVALANKRILLLGAGGAARGIMLPFIEQRPASILVANRTPATAELPPIPGSAFIRGGLALDIMYGSEPSPFMRFAKEQGAATRDGLGMLVEQAAEAFAIWRGVRPDTRGLLDTLRNLK